MWQNARLLHICQCFRCELAHELWTQRQFHGFRLWRFEILLEQIFGLFYFVSVTFCFPDWKFGVIERSVHQILDEFMHKFLWLLLSNENGLESEARSFLLSKCPQPSTSFLPVAWGFSFVTGTWYSGILQIWHSRSLHIHSREGRLEQCRNLCSKCNMWWLGCRGLIVVRRWRKPKVSGGLYYLVI